MRFCNRQSLFLCFKTNSKRAVVTAEFLERYQFWWCVLVFQSFTAFMVLTCVACWFPPSADGLTPLVPSTRHSTLDDRVFPLAVAWTWNSWPSLVRDLTSMTSFCRHLYTLSWPCIVTFKFVWTTRFVNATRFYITLLYCLRIGLIICNW